MNVYENPKYFGIVAFCLAIALMRTASFAQAAGPRDYLDRPDDWFASAEGRQIADHILSHQSELGGWPKNVDTTAKPYTGNRDRIQPTFDNGATADEMRYLARMYKATRQDQDREAFERGLDHILAAQYPNGGWPQRFPTGSSYHRHITFNDNAMTRMLEFLRELGDLKSAAYGFVDDERQGAAQRAFDLGIDCILRCQIEVEGQLTAWCAQHHAEDLSPVLARSYELPSLSGSESVGIVRLLMSLEDPSPEVIQAVEAAVVWFEAAKLEGIRVVQQDAPGTPRGWDRVVVEDPKAPPIWARFYEIGTNTPLFVDRDGVPKSSLAEISYERRNGYSWLGNWPERLLEREYPAWKERLTSR